jgi:hypothetical protein
MSDDDVFEPFMLNKTIDCLNKTNKEGYFTPFFSGNVIKRKYNEKYFVNSNEKDIGRNVYSSILFSGLIFKKDEIKHIDASLYTNTMYFQVYLYLFIAYNFGFYYIDVPVVRIVGDGENGFGISDSSIKNPLLADRKNYLSNLEFHKGLFSIIGLFDKQYATNVKASFEKEYILRSYI